MSVRNKPSFRDAVIALLSAIVYNKGEIKKFIDIEELLEEHKSWWELLEQEDASAYPPAFRRFVKDFFSLY